MIKAKSTINRHGQCLSTKEEEMRKYIDDVINDLIRREGLEDRILKYER